MNDFVFGVKYDLGNFPGVVAKVMDNESVVSKFEFQSRYFFHFQTNTPEKGMYSHGLPGMSLIVQLSFYKVGFGFK